MSEYKKRTFTVTGIQRARSVTINMIRGEPPKALFQEEELLEDTNNNIISRDVDRCQTDLNLTNGTIQIRNPNTGELTGQSVTHAQLLVILYSLYIETATKRDSGG